MRDLILPTPDREGKIYITLDNLVTALIHAGMTPHTFTYVMAPQMGLTVTYIGSYEGNAHVYCIEKNWRGYH